MERWIPVLNRTPDTVSDGQGNEAHHLVRVEYMHKPAQKELASLYSDPEGGPAYWGYSWDDEVPGKVTHWIEAPLVDDLN